MDSSSNTYFPLMAFSSQTGSQAAPMTFPASLQEPQDFPTSLQEEEEDFDALTYNAFNPIYDAYDPSNPCSMSFGRSITQTPLQRHMQRSEEQYQTLFPYPRQTSSSPYMTGLSPPAVDPLCYQTDHQHDGGAISSRAPSFTSMSSAWASPRLSEHSRSDMSRSASPNASEMARYGQLQAQGTWRCAFPGCTSKSIFRRGCDLRKHYRRHTKSLFCRYAGCKQASEGGFSSEKDRARHEAKHDPQIACEWKGCERVFSRVDNMRDHVRRIHRRKQTA